MQKSHRHTRYAFGLGLLFLTLAGCDKHAPKKPDEAKGVVSGQVICADTGKPARFATVLLTAAPRKEEKLADANPLPESESAETDLEGRFRMEAVEPGRYYAFARLNGYLDPEDGLDFRQLDSLESDRARNLAAVEAWKTHLVEVTVVRGRSSEVQITLERAAEIGGTVSFDDGSPAIGLHFQLFRKTPSGLHEVGLQLLDNYALHAVSDSHGHFALTNLTAGEYVVCALIGADSQDAAMRVCTGGVFRAKSGKAIRVGEGERYDDAEIILPLQGLHTLAGAVTALKDGHGIPHGKVQLLWADDRELVRETALDNDGGFQFACLPEGKFLLLVVEAQDDAGEVQAVPNDPNAGAQTEKKAEPARYAVKEFPVTMLQDNQSDLQLQLTEKQGTRK
jgi:hypothetical protein